MYEELWGSKTSSGFSRLKVLASTSTQQNQQKVCELESVALVENIACCYSGKLLLSQASQKDGMLVTLKTVHKEHIEVRKQKLYGNNSCPNQIQSQSSASDLGWYHWSWGAKGQVSYVDWLHFWLPT